MKRHSEDIHKSILQRLKNQARAENLPQANVLLYYGMQCFLNRLSCTEYWDKFILKGGMIFNALEIPNRRATRDLDFQGVLSKDKDNLISITKEICEINIEPDGVVFDTSTITAEEIMFEANYPGVRTKFLGYLGKSRINMVLDVSFGGSIVPNALVMDFPTLLDVPSFKIRRYPLETVVSEKLETTISKSEFNSRRKDFYDLWLLSQEKEFDGTVLVKAIRATFQDRNTKLPSDIHSIFSDQFIFQHQSAWVAFLRREALDRFAPEDFENVVNALRLFLLPPIEAIDQDKLFEMYWKPKGPWRSKPTSG